MQEFLHRRYPFAKVERESVLCLKMASETEGAGESIQLESFARGHHVDCTSWTSSFGNRIMGVARIWKGWFESRHVMG